MPKIICPSCGKEISDQSESCAFCGSTLLRRRRRRAVPEVPEPQIPEQVPAPEVSVPADLDYRFPAGNLTPPGNGGRKNRKKRLVIICAALALVIAAVVLVLTLTGKKEEKPAGSDAAVAGELSEEDMEESDPELQVYHSRPENVVTDEDTGIRYINNELLLMKTKDAPDEEVRRLIAEQGGTIVGRNGYVRQYQVQFPAEYNSLDTLQDLIGVFEDSGLFQGIYPNYYFDIDADSYQVNDAEWADWDNPKEADIHWGADAIQAPEMWELMNTVQTSTVNVGVLDSTFYTDHKDLTFNGTFENHFESHTGEKGWSHGTHVAGIIAADHNQTGIAGVSPNVNLFGFSWLGRDALPEELKKNEKGQTVSGLQAGLTYLICSKQCKVINYSAGFDDPFYNLDGVEYLSDEYYKRLDGMITETEKPIIESMNIFLYEYGLDFVIVAAAGNSNLDNTKIPQEAVYNSVLCHLTDKQLRDRVIIVGNGAKSDEGYYIMDDSSCGQDTVDLLAPGTKIYSSIPENPRRILTDSSTKLSRGNRYAAGKNTERTEFVVDSGYGYKSGTSMAAPQVAGVAANIWSVNPDLTGPQVKQIILDTSTGQYGYRSTLDPQYFRNDRHRMLDGYAAVQRALQLLDSPTGTSDYPSGKKEDVPLFYEDGCYKGDPEDTETGHYAVEAYSNQAWYRANEAVTFKADILGGTPPFTVYWTVEEDYDPDLNPDYDAFLDGTEYRTYNRHVEFTVVPWAEGNDLWGKVVVIDSRDVFNFPYSTNECVVFPLSEWKEKHPGETPRKPEEDFPLVAYVIRDVTENGSVRVKEGSIVQLMNEGYDAAGRKFYYAKTGLKDEGAVIYADDLMIDRGGELAARAAQKKAETAAGTRRYTYSSEWQDIYIKPSSSGSKSIDLLTVCGEDIDTLPAGTILGRYTFYTDLGTTNWRITASKPKLPDRLMDRLKERNETWVLLRQEDTEQGGSTRTMLYVFSVDTTEDLVAEYDWGLSRVRYVSPELYCPAWYLIWSEEYFSGMAFQYPGLSFDFARNNEPSMYRQVTETDFPIPKSYLELVLRCLESPYSESTVYATE